MTSSLQRGDLLGFSFASVKTRARLSIISIIFSLAACGGNNTPVTEASSAPPALPSAPIGSTQPASPAALSTFTIGGTVTGLRSGVSLQLSNNDSDSATISATGSFSFPTALASGTSYSVAVAGQPAGQTCIVTNGSGTVATSNVTTVSVNCVQAEFALVPNGPAGTTSVYRIDPVTGALNQVKDSPFPTGNMPVDIAVASSGTVAYIAQAGSNSVQGFSMDPSTGKLTSLGAATPIGSSPVAITIDRPDSFVFTANTAGNSVTTLSIDSTSHALSVANTSLANEPVALVASPSLESLYVANEGDISLSSFSITPGTGALALVLSFALGGAPTAMTVSPSTPFLYVVSGPSRTFSVAHTDASTGSFLALVTTPLTFEPTSLASSLDGNFIYIGSQSNTIQTFAFTNIAPTGSPVASSTPRHLTVEPGGRWLYATTDDATIEQFSIDATSGTLTPVSGGTVTTSSIPETLVVAQPVL